ncbi:MAG TPA: hypothetical protein V6D28_17810 [Leptolyngbyaceae cyanobacterium]
MANWQISLPQNVTETLHQLKQTVNDRVSKLAAGSDPPLPGEGLFGSPFPIPPLPKEGVSGSPSPTSLLPRTQFSGSPFPTREGGWGVRFSELTNRVINQVTQATDQFVDRVTETTENAKHSLSQTATNTVNAFHQATHKTVESVTQTAINAVDTVTSATDRTVDKITQTTSIAIENSLIAFMNQKINAIKIWLDAHPALSWVTKALAWVITHPILGIIIIVLSIFALQRFIKALGQFLEQVFLLILQTPFKFGQFILGLCLKPFARFTANGVTDKSPQVNAIALNPTAPPPVNEDKKERLTYIFKRLEALRQEETDLLQEVTSILKSNENLR